MINKTWQKITAHDVKQLVDDVVPESHTLDYKEALPNDSPKSELDFLIDVAAFCECFWRRSCFWDKGKARRSQANRVT